MWYSTAISFVGQTVYPLQVAYMFSKEWHSTRQYVDGFWGNMYYSVLLGKMFWRYFCISLLLHLLLLWIVIQTLSRNLFFLFMFVLLRRGFQINSSLESNSRTSSAVKGSIYIRTRRKSTKKNEFLYGLS